MKAAELIIPILICVLMAYALAKKVNVYKAFVEGASEALPQLISILPYLAAMLSAIELIRASGVLGAIVGIIEPAAERIGIPAGTVPIIVLRPFSGSASLALLRDTLIRYGPDSASGRAASVIVGSTETVFYTIAVYFGAAGVTGTRHAVPVALISGAVGCAVGIALIGVM